MRLRRTELFPLLKAAALKWNADSCVRLGASLSYYTIFSLFPLILVVLTMAQLLLANSDAARNGILDALARVTGGFRDEFLSALEAAQQSGSTAGVIGVIMLLLGASW